MAGDWVERTCGGENGLQCSVGQADGWHDVSRSEPSRRSSVDLDHSVKATADVVYWHFASNEQCAPDVGKSGDKRTRGRLQIDVIMRSAGGRVECTKIRAGQGAAP